MRADSGVHEEPGSPTWVSQVDANGHLLHCSYRSEFKVCGLRIEQRMPRMRGIRLGHHTSHSFLAVRPLNLVRFRVAFFILATFLYPAIPVLLHRVSINSEQL